MKQVRRSPSTFRNDVLDALAEVVQQRPDRGRRQRSDDSMEEARGAA
jgi:hypothetical protein